MHVVAASDPLIDAASWIQSTNDLKDALTTTGWQNPAEFVFESAALVRAMEDPSRMKSSHRFLALERLGMMDRPVQVGMHLSTQELQIILARMSILDRGSAYTTEQAASLLGLSASDVTALASAGSLYGFETGREIVFPGWQFSVDPSGSRAAPISDALASIIAFIPIGAVPGLVRAVMTLDNPMIPKRGGMPASPRQHLLEGGSYRPVAATLSYFLEGSLDRFMGL